MGLRERFDEKIKKKEAEIQYHENIIRDAKVYIQALQDSIKLLPKEENVTTSPEEKFRRGSDVYKTYELLKNTGSPMHINDILKGIGKTTSKRDRTSLCGSIGFYKRKNEIFTRPAPNTFGLIEWDSKPKEPPDDFGLEKDATKESDVF